MKITVAAIGSARTRSKSEAVDKLTADYIERASRYTGCELRMFETESSLLQWLGQRTGRIPAQAVFLDSAGRLLTSEQFAAHLGLLRDSGTQRLLVAIGPADGWSAEAKTQANLLFSLGRITLPHGLARAVLAEQIYRALTILSGHPYHSGH